MNFHLFCRCLKAQLCKNFERDVIEVKIPYFPEASERLRGVKDKKFEIIGGFWEFPFTAFEEVYQILDEVCESVEIVKFWSENDKKGKFIPF